MMFIQTIKNIFPNSILVDAALKYPITKDGWDVEMPGTDECRFDEPDFRLILNLQDMLTTKPSGHVGHNFVFHDIPLELAKIRNFYKDWAPLEQIIVVTWPMGLTDAWPEDSFNIIEFSTHQYETWLQYKHNEDVIRHTFSDGERDFKHNFVCMNRTAKPHRKIVYDRLNMFGNCSMQDQGRELKYPCKSVEEYNVEYDNYKNLISLKENFNTSVFSVVTESQYHERFGIITEKTFNAIVAGHPFLMVGHMGALEHVKGLGFVTFEGMFDEEYDVYENDMRIDHMIHSNKSILTGKLTPSDMKELYHYQHAAIDFNRNFFFEEFGTNMKNWLEVQLLNVWNG